jgi:hypothetical protein
MPDTNVPQLLSGARGVFSYVDANGNSVVLAIATDCTVNSRYGNQATFVLSRENAAGIDPVSLDCDVSIGRVIPVNQIDGTSSPTPWQAGSQTSHNDAYVLGLKTLIQNMATANSLTLSLQDKVTGAYVGSVSGCRSNGGSASVAAQAIAGERLSFTGIYDSGYAGEDSPDAIGFVS